MTNKEILEIAMKQSALDINVAVEDFTKAENVFVKSGLGPLARKYCSVWSNLRSVKNVIKSGFMPAWVEMTVKPSNVVDEMNK